MPHQREGWIAPPGPSARLPWFRKAGRRILRYLRPLVAPLLNRLQQRLNTAIDYSAPAAVIRDIDRRLAAAEISLREIRYAAADSLRSVQALLEQQAAVLPEFDRQVAIRLERLQLGMDATRLDQQAALQASGQAIRDILACIGDLRAGQHTAEAEANLAFARLQLAVETARSEQQAAAVGSREGSVTSRELTGLLLQRADLLLQRVAIPLGAEVLVRTEDGFLLAPAEDERLVAVLHEGAGRLEPGTVSVMSALLNEGDWVVDVGAHIGTTVLPVARRVGPGGRIIAVEAASRMRDLLRRNLALNGMDNRVTLHACAAGEAAGHAVLNLGPVSGHSSLLALPEADRTETVEVQPLDALVEPGRHIRLVKLDAEGFELFIWRGMRRIIADNPGLAVLVEFGPEHLRRAGVSVDAWFAEMRAPGFTAYEVDETDASLRPLRAMPELATVFSVNLLLLRQPPAAFPALHFA